MALINKTDVDLGINDDPDSLGHVRSLIQKYAANSICVAHDRDTCAVLDILHERVAPARNDKVNKLVELEQSRYFRSGLNGLYIRVRDGSLRKSSRNRPSQDLCCLR